MAKRKTTGSTTATALGIQSVAGVISIPASTFVDPVSYVAVVNTLGSAPYVGPIFRVDQNGAFLENVWAKVTMNAASAANLRIVVPMNYRDTSIGALYDPSASFTATIYPDLTHSFYVDQNGQPVLSPRYVVELS